MFRSAALHSRLRPFAVLVIVGFLATATVAVFAIPAGAGVSRPAEPRSAPHAATTEARAMFRHVAGMPRESQMLALSHIAHTYNVTKLTDPNPPTGTCPSASNCTMRAAITSANTHSGVDLINVPAGTIKLDAGNGSLAPTTSMFIVGKGPAKTAVSGQDATQLFYVNGPAVPFPSVEITGFTLRNGKGTNGGGVSIDHAALTLHGDVLRNNTAANGAAIYLNELQSDLWLTNSSVRSNKASSYGGGLYFNSGQAMISNTTIGGSQPSQGNVAPTGGGGLYNNDADVALYDSHVDRNRATAGSGGGIYNFSHTLVMRRGSVSHNVATNSGGGVAGGGIYNDSYPMQLVSVSVIGNVAKGGSGDGGGIYNAASMLLSRSHVDRNALRSTSSNNDFHGGGISNYQDLTFFDGTINNNRIANASGSTYLNGFGAGVYENSATTIYNSSVSGNKIIGFTSGCTAPCISGASDGGGVYDDELLSLSGVTLNHNYALGGGSAKGGAIFSDPLNAPGLAHLTLIGNKVESNSYVEGGAIDSSDDLSITDTKVASTTGVAHGSNGTVQGGVLYCDDVCNLTNVTISKTSNNGANTVESGVIYGGSGANLNHVTISDTTNKALGSGGTVDSGGVVYVDYGSGWRDVTIANTINIAGKSGGSGSSINGGIAYLDDNIQTRNVLIRNTSNTVLGSAGSVNGGAIYTGSRPNLNRTRIANTTNLLPGMNAGLSGGALFLDGYNTLSEVAVVGTTGRLGGGNSYVYGGAIYGNNNWQMNQVTVANTLARATGTGSKIYGGGIYGSGGIEVSNSTFAHNAAVTPNATGSGPGAFGGAFYLDNTFGIELTNVTINGNSASNAGGAIYSYDSQVYFKNTVLSKNGGKPCSKATGGYTSTGHNDGPATGCRLTGGGDFNKNPLLGPLANNGGFAPTEMPAATSPLVNGGTNAGCPTVDERGVARPQGPRCDVGAVERK